MVRIILLEVTCSSLSVTPKLATASKIRTLLAKPSIRLSPALKEHSMTTWTTATPLSLANSSTRSTIALSDGVSWLFGRSFRQPSILPRTILGIYQERANAPYARGDHTMSPMPASLQYGIISCTSSLPSRL